ncbi:MAG: hypothetical protein WAO02_17715 [Verrucomicrobiia bacterium]
MIFHFVFWCEPGEAHHYSNPEILQDFPPESNPRPLPVAVRVAVGWGVALLRLPRPRAAGRKDYGRAHLRY